MATFNTEELKHVNKVIDTINKKRQRELIEANDPNGIIQKYIQDQKKNAGYKRTGKAGWIKIASIPYEVDQWFVKMYGPEYFKDKSFFERFPEWKVINSDSRKV